MNFEQKVKSMSGKEILSAMIEGLKNPSVMIDMGSFGYYSERRDICFGCAATNTICKISGLTFSEENINYLQDRSKFIKSSDKFLENFEYAIDSLREGNLDMCNCHLKEIGCNEIPEIEFDLPLLCTEYYKEDLKYYEEYLKLI